MGQSFHIKQTSEKQYLKYGKQLSNLDTYIFGIFYCITHANVKRIFGCGIKNKVKSTWNTHPVHSMLYRICHRL